MTPSDIRSIMQTLERNNNRCQGAPQQVSNGLFRAYEMVREILFEMDEEKTCTEKVSSITATMNRNSTLAQSAYHESANAGYRLVELLEVMIGFLDKTGTYSSEARSVLGTMSRNDAMCQGAPGQIANGLYRIVDMLCILNHLIAPEIEGKITDITREMERMNARAQSAPQQGACGSDAIANILYTWAVHFDAHNQYTAQTRETISLMQRNNNLCQGADQQTANYVYRSLDFMSILANLMLDKAQARIAQYWEDHADEKQALLTEKAALEGKIAAIQKQAENLENNSEYAALKTKCQQLEAQMKTLGQERVDEVAGRIAALRAQQKAAGLFAFGVKKRLEKDIDAALQEQKRVINEVAEQRRPLLQQIQDIRLQLNAARERIEAQKAEVLADITPLQTRVQTIEHLLTRKR